MYVELHAASAFSFLQAASSPEALVARAVELGYPALALLDRDGVYGAPRFHKAARAAGLRPIIGAELTMQAAAGHQWILPVLVESTQGWRHLCQLISRMKLRASKGHGALTLADLEGQVGGLVALVGDPLLQVGRDGVGGLLDRLIGTFGRTHLYVELQRHLQREQEDANAMLVSLAEAFRVPLVATGGVRYATVAERPLCDVLACIRARTTLEAAGRRLAPNAERLLKAPAQMARLFADRPEAVQTSRTLAERLQFSMHDLGYRFPRYPVPHGETEHGFLSQMVEVGARHRYQPYHDRARAQITRELRLIDTLNLAGYFLIVWDIVNFCRQHDILVQGRGSAANSAVCYSLGITAVDPVGMELLFERFLSEERGEWPDIDLDLPSGPKRERVIQYVYDKYGPHGAAMTANVITYRGRSAAREVGKVLGMAPADIDRLSAVLAHAGGRAAPDANGTLRVTFGTVKGVESRDGLFYLPQTTLRGVAAKATGTGDFQAPAAQLAAITALRAGATSPYVDPRLKDVPVNFLSNVDTTGGNSGSPTLNARGELVGLLFDGTYDTVASDYFHDRERTRSIHCDSRYLLWVMSAVDRADHLVRELTIVP